MNFLMLMNILFIIIGIIIVLVFIFIRRLYKSLVLKNRWSNARLGEIKATSFLKKNGFKIIKEQYNTKIIILLNDIPTEVQIRPDFLVTKNGRLCIVDVKTGEKAIDPLNSMTRRQLLEYSLIPGIDDVYLLDILGGRIIKMSYSLPDKSIQYFAMRDLWLYFFVFICVFIFSLFIFVVLRGVGGFM
ncbi:MAG: hypothetical protein A2015_06515 [Spirochaetes bacterium GWF1_31_7]|nr:MAG: hypothetical protein A2Y30_08350 [Spirochaetes bacterium GWE1_32_154]OHD51398.1 MAG: hypothetical protein A2Y29_14735 [Spirochaetes bacterium GWE2_31_10]OHD53124.1 MAG: hypothetical protein A2015_06515 [Spirochaetes bacterium GWF1_31_7]OHD82267.1 MAG: hypothetical protein A2355_01015 [Spirochaetes bacterium RIFOXYB1_FULL_32_8]HBD94455.1 hypothetical protein [Spirochaetia bacterium]